MRYKEQKSVDEGKTWEDTGLFFKSKKAVADYIWKSTPNGILDYRAGDYWVLRRDKDGIRPHYQVVKVETK